MTIICPSYNSARFIRRLIHSILAQTCQDYEFIVVDGGSTDGTLDILRQYEGRIKYISEPDTGIYNAMNKGVRMATSDWVYFIGADDYLCSVDVLERIEPSLTNETDVVLCRICSPTLGVCTSEMSPRMLLRNTVQHQGAIYRREILLRHPYDESFRIVADYELNLFVRQEGLRIKHDNTILAYHEPFGVSGIPRWQNYREEIMARNRYLQDSFSRVCYSAFSILKFTGKRLRWYLDNLQKKNDVNEYVRTLPKCCEWPPEQLFKDGSCSKRNPLLVSFIVPYHNEPAEYIRSCIESILALNLRPEEREIIVVDDGSDVCLSELIENFVHDIHIVRQENSGLSVARNTGLSVANGEYIQFVDADDTLIADAYNVVLDRIRIKHEDVVMFHASFHLPSEAYSKKAARRLSCMLFKIKEYGSGNTPGHDEKSDCSVRTGGTEYLLNNNLRAAAWGYVFRKDLLEKTKSLFFGMKDKYKFEEGILHEDALFTPPLLLTVEHLCDLDIEAYFYRQHSDSIMSRRDAEHIRRRMHDFLDVQQRLRHIQKNTNQEFESALSRVIDQQTMCDLYNTWQMTHSMKMLRTRFGELHTMGFLPLSVKFYSLKYLVFSLAANICCHTRL